MAEEGTPDILTNLKHLAYCRVFGVPGSPTSLKDLIQKAKFFLCERNCILWNDGIWDRYTDEELIIEYLSYVFHEEDDFCTEFLQSIGKTSQAEEDMYEWFDTQMEAEENAQVPVKPEDLVDSVEFSPNDLKG